ncbi:MAG: hypothetical protein ACHQHN_03895 [Sphingobacteriales bacterium]
MSTLKKDSKELDTTSMIIGIGRKATDEELINYLLKDNDISPISLEEAFSKYLDQESP